MMRGLVSMIIMTILWQKRRVTLYQQGTVFAIGTIIHISDNWINIKQVIMANGGSRDRLAVSRNRIDAFWKYCPGDESLLQALGVPAVTQPEECVTEQTHRYRNPPYTLQRGSTSHRAALFYFFSAAPVRR